MKPLTVLYGTSNPAIPQADFRVKHVTCSSGREFQHLPPKECNEYLVSCIVLCSIADDILA